MRGRSTRILTLTTLREIRASFGRFASIMAIIALGVGFFAGVRITTPVMVHTVEEYYREQGFHDLRVLSTIGWEDEDVEAFEKLPGVIQAAGSVSLDMVFDMEGDPAGEGDALTGQVLKLHTIPDEGMDSIILKGGRMPVRTGECLLDHAVFSDDCIGMTIGAGDENKSENMDRLSHREYTVVGTADSPLYINFERGTTSIGNGQIKGFMYVLPSELKDGIYTEIDLRMDVDEPLYSDEYDDAIDGYVKALEDAAEIQARRRYERIYDDTDVTVGFARMANVLLQMEELDRIDALTDPETYVLGRETNIAYVCFESDSRIVSQIARVFPVFFILVAALVCTTTMGRMVEQERGMIGTLKALGYSGPRILMRYMTYSGSAAILGCVVGYAVGTILFPWVIWQAYQMMYQDITLQFIWDTPLALISLAVSLLCSMGATWATCRVELSETAAMLMRPRAPKAGKRVFLERIPALWRRIRFLHKVSIRNIFRYKGRLLMMVMGISGCTALLLTGFGIRDTIADFADIQYGEIQFMDAELTFKSDASGQVPESVTSALEAESGGYLLLHEASWDLLYDRDRVKSISLVAPDSYEDISRFMDFHDLSGDPIAPPGLNEALVSNSISERYGVRVGDVMTLRDEDMRELHLRVSGVFENLVYNYVFVDYATLPGQLGEEVELNGAYVLFPEGEDQYMHAAALSDPDEVRNVTILEDLRERLSNMMKSLDLVVLVVILSAAGLAFIVLYDLTNINITERLREIATIKVLGFFRRETSQYVLRENAVLTGLGIAVGLGLGVLLHRFVIHEIVVDMVSFKARILPMSFIYSIVLTFVFDFAVGLVMGRKLDEIDMAESLKSVE